jgi:adenylate kinase family enzyme
VQRVVIVGSGGAGKSALATALSERTGLQAVHLDKLFWKPGWTPPRTDEFRADLEAAIADERWILDGNFLQDGAGDPRFDRADTVIFLDLPMPTCLWRVLARRVRERSRARPDLPEGCRETVDLSFLRWIWRYPRKNRPRVLAILAGLDEQIDVCRLHSPSEVQRYIANS